MYVIVGKKLKGNEFRGTYTDEKIAYFEFEVTQLVAEWMVLSYEEGEEYKQLEIFYNKG